uniref:Uncharacterized protein n=1 Tax=Megaselia scalaris TaxID=36166 RepID=T1GG93_MEGSC
RGYLKYNLENSAILLRNAFPRAHIIVVRPVRMEFKTFSCFDNFVRGNNAGVPDHTPLNHALQHLEKLLQNLSHRLVSIPENDILLNSESSRNENNLTIENNSKNSSGNTSNQEIDIDILQVQDNITVDTDGKLVSSANSDSINNSSYNKNQESSETSVIQTEKSQNSESNNKNEMMLTTSTR